MLEHSNDIQSNQRRGGARKGAGRPRRTEEELQRWYGARGINPLHASEILAKVIDERAAWRRVLTSNDDRVVLSALTFLVAMRDGKPAQQINVTSLGVNISTDDIAKARDIVRSLTRPPDTARIPSEILDNDANKGVEQAIEPMPPLMLSGDEGGNSGGE